MPKEPVSSSPRLAAVRRTALNRHPGSIIIIYVLRGELNVRVGSERFLLDPGDYAVLNAGDPHMFAGTEDNVTLIQHFTLGNFRNEIPEIDGVIFACESFDLPRFRGTEDYLRKMILGTALANPEEQHQKSVQLLEVLSSGYAFESYYQRQVESTTSRQQLFHKIVRLMRQHLTARDVLGSVSDLLHYRKGSLSRIVRQTTAISFSDLLRYLRVEQAEILLLESDETMLNIASLCGFSDVKYFTRAFRAWFGLSPSEYRRTSRPLTVMGEDVQYIDAAEGIGYVLLQRHQQISFRQQRQPRLSFTPLLIKNLGGRTDLFKAIANGNRTEIVSEHTNKPPKLHILPISVPDDGVTPVSFVELISGVDTNVFLPILIFTKSSSEFFEEIFIELRKHKVRFPEVWFAYESGLETEADFFVAQAKEKFGAEARPLRLG